MIKYICILNGIEYNRVRRLFSLGCGLYYIEIFIKNEI